MPVFVFSNSLAGILTKKMSGPEVEPEPRRRQVSRLHNAKAFNKPVRLMAVSMLILPMAASVLATVNYRDLSRKDLTCIDGIIQLMLY